MNGQTLTISEGSVQLLEHHDLGPAIDISKQGVRPPKVAAWLPDALEEIEAIARYVTGWDSHGAASPVPSLVAASLNLLISLAQADGVPKPRIIATRRGGIQLEWESGPRYFELEIVAERAAEYFFEDTLSGIEEAGAVFENESLTRVAAYIRAVFGSSA